MAERRICVAAVAGAHGVRGLVRLKTFTEAPEGVAELGALTDEAGERTFQIDIVGRAKGTVLARLEGVSDRDQAQALRGTRLYAPRAGLPPLEEDTYYHADLIGLAVEDAAGRSLGTVRALHDFGAGDLIEIGPDGGTSVVLPFTRQCVPVIDLEAGRVVVELPPEPEEETSENATETRGKAGHGARKPS